MKIKFKNLLAILVISGLFSIPILCSAQTTVGTNSGIIQGHAYTVLGTYELDGIVYVLLRNPWGAVEEVEADELPNIDLQNALQKQQQTLQMLSNVSKVLHDTSLAIKRKKG